MNTYEFGYTPKNLRCLLVKNRLQQKDVYVHLGKSRNIFARYLLDVEDKNHVSMAHKDWLKVIELTS